MRSENKYYTKKYISFHFVYKANVNKMLNYI